MRQAVGFVAMLCLLSIAEMSCGLESNFEYLVSQGLESGTSGKCSEQVMSILRQPINEYFLTQCPRDAFGRHDATEKCIKQNIPVMNTPIAKSCVDCFTAVSECAADHCKLSCMFGSCSERCTNCVADNCGAEHESCTGYTLAQLPQCRSSKPSN